jgi:hypothetical protein
MKGANYGAAYTYSFNGSNWEEVKYVASDGDVQDQFGHSVSIDGEMAIVGAVYDQENGCESGSAYVLGLGYVVDGDCDDAGELANPITLTIDTYSHVMPGLEEAAARRIDDILGDAVAGNS